MTLLSKAPLRTVARRSLRVAPVPLVMAIQRLGGIITLRIRYTWSTPTAPEVIANYMRGLVLFGRSGARLAKFEWRSFPMRGVITKETANVPKNLRRVQRQGEMEVRFDTDFEAIIRSCQEGRTGWMWITPALVDVYRDVHSLGFVSTVGTYRDGRLVGGLWGIAIGRTFGIMSIFHRESNAGSLAIAALVDAVLDDDRLSVIDCGVMAPKFDMYGAREIPAEDLCELVRSSLGQKSLV